MHTAASMVLVACLLAACGSISPLVGDSPEEKARKGCRAFDTPAALVDPESDKVAALRVALKRHKAAARLAQEAASSDTAYSELSTAYDAFVVAVAESIDAMAALQAGDVTVLEFADLMPDVDYDAVRDECRALFSPNS